MLELKTSLVYHKQKFLSTFTISQTLSKSVILNNIPQKAFVVIQHKIKQWSNYKLFIKASKSSDDERKPFSLTTSSNRFLTLGFMLKV